MSEDVPHVILHCMFVFCDHREYGTGIALLCYESAVQHVNALVIEHGTGDTF